MNTDLFHIDQYLSGELPLAEDSVRSLSLLISSDQVSFHQVQLPDAPKAKWKQLLPWIMEDQLLMPVDELHLVICSVDAERLAQVISIPKSEMHRVQLLLEKSSSGVSRLIPDILALPLQEGFTSLAKCGDRLLVRSGQYEGFSGSPEFVWSLLEMQESQKELLDEPLKFQCFGMDAETIPSWALSKVSLNTNAIDWAFTDYPAEANLLVADYKSQRKLVQLGPWLPTLIAASIAFVLFCGWVLIDHKTNARELAQLNPVVMNEFEAHFGVPLSQLNLLQRQGSQIISEKEARYLSSAASVWPVTESIDAALSSCPECRIESLVIESDAGQIRIENNASVLATIARAEALDVTLSEPNANDEVVITFIRQAQ